VLCFNRLN